ncbi:MAG: YajQ family cyclic di-GMP-binding protein [Selenomonadales bacterium]|nr:YajQ family cyclic di-GMP-binding protein [Selenomonadales bacterium]
MAKDCSFDVVSDVDLQEVDNAVNQAIKEIGQRFDFRGSKSSITLEKDVIKLVSDDDFKMKNVTAILEAKMVKRGVSIKCLDYGKIEPAAQGTVRQTVKLKKGIQQDNAKKVVAEIKKLKLKVQTQIMDDQVRVSGKNKDDLQQAIAALKAMDLDIDLQFTNFRS